MSLIDLNNIAYIIIVCLSVYLLFYRKKNHFENSNISTIDDIIKGYKLDIPSTRNLAQIINKAFVKNNNKYSLYLPINNVDFKNKLTITNNCTVNKTTKINNILEYLNKNSTNVNYDIFPQYTILAWGLELEKIPKNWKLCDGKVYVNIENVLTLYDKTNSKHIGLTQCITPDLSNRLLMNEYTLPANISRDDIINNLVPLTSSYEFNKIGGTESVILLNNNIPLHSHFFQYTVNEPGMTYNKRKIYSDYRIDNDGNKPDSYPGRLTTINKNLYLDQVALGVDLYPVKKSEIIDSSFFCIYNVEESCHPQYVLNDRFNIKTTTSPHNNMPPYTKIYYIIKLQ